MHESCGVFGIYAPGVDVARITFFGLFALQHRGQESAGIATADGKKIYLHSQLKAVPFYERNGFVKTGEPFKEAGMEHYHMDFKT